MFIVPDQFSISCLPSPESFLTVLAAKLQKLKAGGVQKPQIGLARHSMPLSPPLQEAKLLICEYRNRMKSGHSRIH